MVRMKGRRSPEQMAGMALAGQQIVPLLFGLLLLFFMAASYALFISSGSQDEMSAQYISAPAQAGSTEHTGFKTTHNPFADCPNSPRTGISQVVQQMLAAAGCQARSAIQRFQLLSFLIFLALLLTGSLVRAYTRGAYSGTFHFQTVLKNALPVRAGPLC